MPEEKAGLQQQSEDGIKGKKSWTKRDSLQFFLFGFALLCVCTALFYKFSPYDEDFEVWLFLILVFLFLFAFIGALWAWKRPKISETVRPAIDLPLVLSAGVIFMVLIFEAFIPVLNYLLEKEKKLQPWDFGNWKVVAFAVFALIGFGTTIWRSKISERQMAHTRQQIENTAKQIALSRDSLEETQTNNLAKLFTDATKFLGEGTTEAEKSAGLSLMEVVASQNARFASEVINVLEAFFIKELGEEKTFSLQNPAHNLAIRSLRIIDGVLIRYENCSFNGEGIKFINNKRMLQPFRKIQGITYIEATFSGVNFERIPWATYKDCIFSDCIIVITQCLQSGITICGPLLRSVFLEYQKEDYQSYIKDLLIVQKKIANKIKIEETIFLRELSPRFTDDEYKEVLSIDKDTCFYDSENVREVDGRMYHSPYGESSPHKPKCTFERLEIKPCKLTDKQKQGLLERENAL